MAFTLCALALTAGVAMNPLDPHVLRDNITPEELDVSIAQASDAPRAVFGLMAAKAEAQRAAGDLLSAAETLQAMASLSSRHPDTIDAEVYAVYLAAAHLLQEAQALEQSRDAYFAALDALTNSAGDIALQNQITLAIADVSLQLGEVEFADNLREGTDEIAQFTAPPKPELQPGKTALVRIRVHYATDRTRSGSPWPSRFYSDVRRTELDYGIATVTVPRNVLPGAIPAPSIRHVEGVGAPNHQTIMQSVTPTIGRDFFASVRQHLDAQQAGDVFVYIPGYGVTFSDGARRAAQLAQDMNFNGVPLVFSWPSKGVPTGYLTDGAAAELSGRKLRDFLNEVVAQSGARKVHVIAHAMGNLALADALEKMAQENVAGAKPRFNQVVFAAPDVDKGHFAEIAGKAHPLAERMTVYVTDQDWTLVATREVHAKGSRAGDAGDTTLHSDDFDTVDVSQLGEDIFARSIADSQTSILLDMAALFWSNPAPGQRCGVSQNEDGVPIWALGQADCASQSILNVIGTLQEAGVYTPDGVREVLERDFADHPDLRKFETLLLSMAAP